MSSLQLFIFVICLATSILAQLEPIPEVSKRIDPEAVDVISAWNYKNQQTKEGYRYSYQTSDNSNRQQEGNILYPGTDKEELVVTGTYTYRHGDYETLVEYTADKNGYRAKVLLNVILAPSLGAISPSLLKSLAG